MHRSKTSSCFETLLIDIINISITGTEVVLNACREENVPYLIYCSSSSVYLGPEAVMDGTETSVSQPSRFYYKAYASSKAKAQDMVLSANGSKLNNGKYLNHV